MTVGIACTKQQKKNLVTFSLGKNDITATEMLCDTKVCSSALCLSLQRLLGVLTAPKFQGAGVHVHREILQVHGALGVDGQPAGQSTGVLHCIPTAKMCMFYMLGRRVSVFLREKTQNFLCFFQHGWPSSSTGAGVGSLRGFSKPVAVSTGQFAPQKSPP